MPSNKNPDRQRLDTVIERTLKEKRMREQSYREQALKLFPWICGRCTREFDRSNLRELTVHHRDHDHDHNPPDGSNWELLCIYCHEQEHVKSLAGPSDKASASTSGRRMPAAHKPFANLDRLLDRK